MEIHGKILSVLEEKTGISPKTGKNWRCPFHKQTALQKFFV